MCITIREFKVAMETYGAKRLSNVVGSTYNIPVPCFKVAGITFLHSGSNYVIHKEDKVPKEIVKQAKEICGEKCSTVDNTGHNKIFSVREMLTMATMLDGKYSKEEVDNLMNETYKKLIGYLTNKSNAEMQLYDYHLQKLQKLYELVAEYKNLVNPYGNKDFTFKEPIQYLSSVNVSMDMQKGENRFTALILYTKSSKAKFKKVEDGWFYDTIVPIQKNHKNGYIHIWNYCEKGDYMNPVDEVIRLYYKADKNSYAGDPNDIDLSISLKTGLVWQNYRKDFATPATKEDIKIITSYLKSSIKKIRSKIDNKIVETQSEI